MKVRALLPFCLFACFVACQRPPSGAESEGPGATVKIGMPTDPAQDGRIRGTVFFRGAPPKPIPIDMRVDGACRGANYAESLVVNEGKLQNVFVYVKGGFTFSPSPEPVIVEQRGCRYVPHVVAAAVSQPVQFRNTDATNHNIHGMPHANEAWNASQPQQAPPMTRTFRHAESMIPVKCNQHPWMKMYINVSDSPFYAITDAQGHFEFKGIPPGTYDVVFVHETLGQQTHTVTLEAKEQKTVDVSFAR